MTGRPPGPHLRGVARLCPVPLVSGGLSAPAPAGAACQRSAAARPGLVVALAGLLVCGAPSAASVVELEAAPTPSVEVALKRATINARVSLGFQRALLLNLEPARAAGLRMFPVVGKRTFRDPLLPGGQAVVRFNLVSADVAGTGRSQMPTVWIDRDIARPPHQGIVSVMGIRADRVVIRQPAAPTGGQTYVLARRGQGSPQMRWKVAGETIDVVLDLGTPVSVMNARAAAALERAGLVRRTGRVALWQPVPALSLPVELLTPAPGASFNGLPLRRPAARIPADRARELDSRVAEGIEGADDDEDDTIVVTGRRERERRGRSPWMLIGSDVLDSCERLELDRPGARWLLTCRF